VTGVVSLGINSYTPILKSRHMNSLNDRELEWLPPELHGLWEFYREQELLGSRSLEPDELYIMRYLAALLEIFCFTVKVDEDLLKEALDELSDVSLDKDLIIRLSSRLLGRPLPKAERSAAFERASQLAAAKSASFARVGGRKDPKKYIIEKGAAFERIKRLTIRDLSTLLSSPRQR